MTNNQILVQMLALMPDGQQSAQKGGAAVVGNCRQCGEPLRRKSKNGRLPEFCNVNCRVAHWREKQKDGKD